MGCSSVVECLPNTCEALDLSSRKEEKEEGKEEKEKDLLLV
jgi:hypothetical protein